MKLNEYLKENTILKVGYSSEYIVCEVIVKNPIELISIVSKEECYISEIRWWHRAKMSMGSDIGYGGPRDPDDSDYFFAETDISKKFDSNSQAEEYYNYIEGTKVKYAQYDLLPAFDIKHKTGDGSMIDTPFDEEPNT